MTEINKGNGIKSIGIFGAWIIFLVAAMPLPLVSAWGVDSPYWGENPLVMSLGEEKVVALGLQNMVGGEDIELEAEMISGSSIATIIDQKPLYIVPPGSKDEVKVEVRVSIPRDAQWGSAGFTVEFRQLAKDEGKMVQMVSSMKIGVPVVIKDAAESAKEITAQTISVDEWGEGSLMVVIFAVVVCIVAALGYVFYRKHKLEMERERGSGGGVGLRE